MTRVEQARCGNCYGTDQERCVVCLRRQRDEAIAERDALKQRVAELEAEVRSLQTCDREDLL